MSDTPFAATIEGRILLALRAGSIDVDALEARIATNKSYRTRCTTAMIAAGLIERYKVDLTVYFRLTEAGKARMPTRRSLEGYVAPECRDVATDDELMEAA